MMGVSTHWLGSLLKRPRSHDNGQHGKLHDTLEHEGMTMLNEEDRALLTGTNFAHIATLLPDGSPHSVVVWVDGWDGLVLVNSTEHSIKVKNLRRDPRVAISVHGQEEPYRMVSVQGRVSEVTTERAGEHIDALTRRYTGQARYPDEWREPGEVRVIVRIQPERVIRYGY
jgi:PPOX class probable F420-dependent enzyme